jgi:tetratricopeptide (TPR) repeat protein
MKQASVWVAIISASLWLFNSPPRFAESVESSEQDYEQKIAAQIGAGQLDVALVEANEALSRFPRSPTLNQLLGVVLFKKGANEQARAAFHRATELDPTLAEASYNLALLELSERRYAEGAIWLEKFLRLNPENAQAHLLLGRAYHNLNRTLPAIEQFKKALALSPCLPLAHYHLGYSYQSQGNMVAARSEFVNEVEVNPGFYDSYWLLGNIDLNRGELDAAERWFQTAIRLKPQAWEARYGLARVFAAQKHWTEAEAEFKKALESGPNRVETHYALARAYQEMGKKEDADREFLICAALRSKGQKPQSGIAGKQP